MAKHYLVFCEITLRCEIKGVAREVKHKEIQHVYCYGMCCPNLKNDVAFYSLLLHQYDESLFAFRKKIHRKKHTFMFMCVRSYCLYKENFTVNMKSNGYVGHDGFTL